MVDDSNLPDEDTAALLRAAASSGLAPLHQLSPAEARKAYADRVKMTNLAPEHVSGVDDLSVAARDGSALRLRIYRSQGGASNSLLLYFHGGGFVIGGIETHDPICRYIAAKSGWNVLSVNYRLAPEHRYPTAVHDALDAFDWIWTQAASLGVDPERIAVGGDSAGGTLAAVVALHARDRGRRLVHQLLLYPALDQGGEYPSRNLFQDRFLLTRESIQWFAHHYYGREEPVLEPNASPSRATDFRGVAPAYILTAELDPLRDEAAHYADLLDAAGVKTRYRCARGLIHGFLGMGRFVGAARRELDEIATRLNYAEERPSGTAVV
jgi:acetyl esterase